MILRPPTLDDGVAIWQLVRDTGVLDENSGYASLLVAEHFAGSSVVAELGGAVIGFISAYRPPAKDDTVFVWQVGVAQAGRGRGLATRMLLDIIQRPACAGVRFVDTTIGPSNQASMALFRGFARRMGANVQQSELFTAAHFPPNRAHDPELLFRIGPFSRAQAND